MFSRSVLIASLTLVVGVEAHAQAAGRGTSAVRSGGPTASTTTICAALTRAIESAEMRLSSLDAQSVGDNSAPRATMRRAEQGGVYSQIQANISLMAAHRCAPYPYPISGSAFMLSALECETAMLGWTSSRPLPESCNRANWTRSDTARPSPSAGATAAP